MPHVDLARACATERSHLALLQRAQQLGQQRRRGLADLVEKEHAAVGRFEEAGLFAIRSHRRSGCGHRLHDGPPRRARRDVHAFAACARGGQLARAGVAGAHGDVDAIAAARAGRREAEGGGLPRPRSRPGSRWRARGRACGGSARSHACPKRRLRWSLPPAPLGSHPPCWEWGLTHSTREHSATYENLVDARRWEMPLGGSRLEGHSAAARDPGGSCVSRASVARSGRSRGSGARRSRSSPANSPASRRAG